MGVFQEFSLWPNTISVYASPYVTINFGFHSIRSTLLAAAGSTASRSSQIPVLIRPMIRHPSLIMAKRLGISASVRKLSIVIMLKI